MTCAQFYASNSAPNKQHASNDASNRDRLASNAVRVGSGVETKAASAGISEGVVREPVEPVRKQRWDRDKYNAYMREYMKRRRAVNEGAAD